MKISNTMLPTGRTHVVGANAAVGTGPLTVPADSLVSTGAAH